MRQTALHVAVLWGNLEAAEALVANSADVNKPNRLTGGTPLHIACSSPKVANGMDAVETWLVSFFPAFRQGSASKPRANRVRTLW